MAIARHYCEGCRNERERERRHLAPADDTSAIRLRGHADKFRYCSALVVCSVLSARVLLASERRLLPSLAAHKALPLSLPIFHSSLLWSPLPRFCPITLKRATGGRDVYDADLSRDE